MSYAHLAKRLPMLHRPAFPKSLLLTSLRARLECPRIPYGTKHLVIPVAYPIRTARPRPAFAGAEIHKETPSKRNASAHPACEEYLQSTVSSNTSSGHMPNAMLMRNFKHYTPKHTGSAMTCNNGRRKTQQVTPKINKPPPHIGGGVSQASQMSLPKAQHNTPRVPQKSTMQLPAYLCSRQCSGHGVGGTHMQR